MEDLFRDWQKDTFWNRFESSDGSNLVYVKREFEKEKGETMVFGMALRTAGTGWVVGNDTLEGKEVALSISDFSITLERYRIAMKDDGDLTRRRPAFDLTAAQRNALKVEATEKWDQLHFDAALLSPTTIVYGGDATTTATIEVADKLTPQLIQKLRVIAVTGNGGGNTRMRPVMVDGQRVFVMVLPNEVGYDFKNDPTYAQYIREAAERGRANPFWTGALAVVDNVALFEHENMPVYDTWGATSAIHGGKCLFLGAGALCTAVGQTPNTVDKRFDYDEQLGMAYRMTMAVAKPDFNNAAGAATDYGVIEARVACTNLM